MAAINNLIDNKNIIIQKADKGNTVVLTDKSVYLEGMKDILSDESKFKKLEIRIGDEIQCLKYILDLERNVRDTLYKYCEANNKRLTSYFTSKKYYDFFL